MAAQASHDALAQLYLQYHARLPPRSPRFVWPDTLGLLSSQSKLAGVLFRDASSESDEYDRAFLKHVVKHIDEAIETCTDEHLAMLKTERQDLVVDDAILERYMQLVSMPESASVLGVQAPPPLLVRHFVPIQGSTVHPILGRCESVQLRQEGMSISQGTTGLTTWEASLCLAAYLAGSSHVIAEQPCILEIGSGTGLLGLVVAQLLRYYGSKQTQLYLSDLEGQVLDRLHESAHMSTFHSLPRSYLEYPY